MDQASQELITRHNEQMRELIVRDIDALQGKLDVKAQVSRKADEAMDKVKGTLGMNQSHNGEGWAGFVRHNAGPLIAVGLGGTVLARNLKDKVGTESQSTTTRLVTESSYAPSGEQDAGIKERTGSVVSDAKSTATDGIDTAKEKVSDVADTARLKAMDAKVAVSDQAVHAKEVVVERIPSREEASRMAHDHNQLLGLAALAIGATVGAFAPRSRAEERRLAPVQAQVKEKASTVVEDSVEKAKETADRAAEALSVAAETAKEQFSDAGDDQPPSEFSTELPGTTQPNRITGNRTGAPSGVNGGGSGSY